MENILLVVIALVALVLFFKMMKRGRCAAPRMTYDLEPQVDPFVLSGLSSSEIHQESVKPEYDYQNFLYKNGLEAERFDSHDKFIADTYSDSLLLGASKDIVRDDPNDINPYLGMRRPNYNVFIGSGARQVPSEEQSQLPVSRAPSFV